MTNQKLNALAWRRAWEEEYGCPPPVNLARRAWRESRHRPKAAADLMNAWTGCGVVTGWWAIQAVCPTAADRKLAWRAK
jgi:hypothetical protein